MYIFEVSGKILSSVFSASLEEIRWFLKFIKGKDIDSVNSGKLIFLMKMHKINGVANIVYKNEHLGDKNTGPFLSTETRILGHSFPIIFLIAFHYGNQSHYFFNRNLNMLGY